MRKTVDANNSKAVFVVREDTVFEGILLKKGTLIAEEFTNKDLYDKIHYCGIEYDIEVFEFSDGSMFVDENAKPYRTPKISRCECEANGIKNYYGSALYGHAINDVVFDVKKELFMVNNGEYGSYVPFCPWCGASAKTMAAWNKQADEDFNDKEEFLSMPGKFYLNESNGRIVKVKDGNWDKNDKYVTAFCSAMLDEKYPKSDLIEFEIPKGYKLDSRYGIWS